MKRNFIILTLMLITFSGFSQAVKGRYFIDIKGTVWQSEEVKSEIIANMKYIGLGFVDIPINSIKVNTTLWFFDDSLTIKNYNAKTKELTAILTCAYVKNSDGRIITLTLDGGKVEYSYVSVSTGSFVGLRKIK